MATLEGNRNLSDKKTKALTTALTQIERSYGKGAIMWMGDDGMRVEIDSIPTGAINLDAAIGIGGIPRGRITEIYGPGSRVERPPFAFMSSLMPSGRAGSPPLSTPSTLWM